MDLDVEDRLKVDLAQHLEELPMEAILGEAQAAFRRKAEEVNLVAEVVVGIGQVAACIVDSDMEVEGSQVVAGYLDINLDGPFG